MNSKSQLKHWLLAGAAAALLMAMPAFGADGDESHLEGLITAVNGKSVHNVAGLMAALRNRAMVGDSIDLEVIRDHRTIHLKAVLP